MHDLPLGSLIWKINLAKVQQQGPGRLCMEACSPCLARAGPWSRPVVTWLGWKRVSRLASAAPQHPWQGRAALSALVRKKLILCNFFRGGVFLK